MTEHEAVSLTRENAALCVLEAEVVIALKLFQAGHGNEQSMLEQITKIEDALLVVDIIRKRNAQQAN
jgi:hypothetical protein